MDALRIVKKDSPAHPSLSKEAPWVSEEIYWKDFYEHPDCQYEWNNGYLEEKPMADLLSIVMYRWFLQLLEEYFKVFPVAQIMGLEMGFRLDLGDNVTIRKPDLAVILHSNPVEGKPLDRSFHGICDICIEFLSDSTRGEVERDTVFKKEEYAKAGVAEYYILDRLGNHTAFYRLDEQGVYEPLDATGQGVIHSRVLNHFAFRLEHLEGQPPFETLVNDPIYQPFVLKSLQEEQRQKEQERRQKEEALQREEQERRQKEEALQREEQARRQKEEALQREEQALAEIERLRALLKK